MLSTALSALADAYDRLAKIGALSGALVNKDN